MFDSIGGGEIMLILLAILVLFGPKRIPDLAQSIGKGLREFRKAQQDLQNNLTKVVNSEDMTKITQSIQGIHQDMRSSVQQLTGQISAAVQQPQWAPPVEPTPPAVPAPAPAQDAPSETVPPPPSPATPPASPAPPSVPHTT